MPGLDTVAGVSGFVSLLGVALFVPALIGTVAITGEYWHRTVATTFLAVPKRGRVLVAKLIAYGGLGLAYGLVLALSAVAGIYAGTAAHGIEPEVGLDAVLGTTARLPLVGALLLLGYALASSALAAVVSLRRDVA